jgi:chromosome segregation ATPase
MPTITDTQIADMTQRISSTFDETFAALIERRDSQYAAAIEPMNAERESLLREHGAIDEKARKHESTLASAARMAQFEADRLTLEGESEQAAAKLREAEEAASAPANLRARQQEISDRIATLEAEKRDIKSRIFETWYKECVTVHRAIEHAHFVLFLDGLRQAFFDFEPHAANNVNIVAGLTADERSTEWQAGNRWYGGR